MKNIDRISEIYIEAIENHLKRNVYCYAIIDREGAEMPRHYSGRLRSLEEATSMAESLNKRGEYAPYKIIKK